MIFWFQLFVLPYVYVVKLGFFQSELIHSLAVLLSNYCSYFGHTFTHNVVSNNSGTYKYMYPLSLILSLFFLFQLKPYFERSLKLPKQNPGAALAEGNTNLTTPVLPIYVSGILSCFKEVCLPYIVTMLSYQSVKGVSPWGFPFSIRVRTSHEISCAICSHH